MMSHTWMETVFADTTISDYCFINGVNIHGKISQNEKKMRPYFTLKDIILNSFSFILKGLLDVSLCSETTCHVRLFFCGRRGGIRRKVLLY